MVEIATMVTAIGGLAVAVVALILSTGVHLPSGQAGPRLRVNHLRGTQEPVTPSPTRHL